MPVIAETALRLLGPDTAPAGLLIAVGSLVLGLMILRHGLRPLELVLGARAHKMLSGAALGLFAAWAVVAAVWLLAPAGL